MPTLNDVLAGSQAQAVQVQQIIDALKGTPNKGVPVALVSLNDPNNYALTVQNDDPVNSRALSVLKADGTTLISADATGVTLGAPVNVPPGSISGSAIAAGSITNAMLGADVARDNLLVNGSFDVWSRGGGPFTATTVFTADRWFTALGGTMSISQNTANADNSVACAAVTATGTGNLLYQTLQGLSEWVAIKGRTFSLTMRVNCNAANACRIGIFDNSTNATTWSAYHLGSGGYQTLSVANVLCPVAASQLQVRVGFDASCTAYLDNAMLVVGSQAANYVPMHPADEMARCLRYYEIMGGVSNFPFIGGIATAAGQGAWTSLGYKAVKPLAPTITKVGTWNVGNTAQPTVGGSPGSDGYILSISSLAAGQFTSQPTGPTTYITIESNP